MKKTLFAAALVSLSLSAAAQSFSVPLEGFSRSKTSYLHMEDGSVKEGLLGGFKRAKGLIETVKMKSESGGKIKIDPAQINFMYLPPSGLAKMNAALDQATNVSKWDAPSNIDESLMGEGYVFFEKTATQIKKKTENLMMQLMNTSFSSKVKVYHDPFAKESMGIAVGGITVAGGLDKSYYVKKEGTDDAAYKLEKKDYKEQFATLFGDCEEFMTKYKDSIKWSELEMHVYEYTQMSK
jgi:hypothetical protein